MKQDEATAAAAEATTPAADGDEEMFESELLLNGYVSLANEGDSCVGRILSYFPNLNYEAGKIRGQFLLYSKKTGLYKLNDSTQLQPLRTLPAGTLVRITRGRQQKLDGGKSITEYAIRIDSAPPMIPAAIMAVIAGWRAGAESQLLQISAPPELEVDSSIVDPDADPFANDRQYTAAELRAAQAAGR